jgi:hypothetical protein
LNLLPSSPAGADVDAAWNADERAELVTQRARALALQRRFEDGRLTRADIHDDLVHRGLW